jgi:prefoldin subunit 5
MAKTNVVTKDEIEEAVRDIWQTAQFADGSRSAMQDALDEIQEKCAEVVPDLEESSENEPIDDDDE